VNDEAAVSSIPNLKLYPTYSWGKPIRAVSGINADSAFTIPATEFSPAYGVNTAPRTNWATSATYFNLDANQRLNSRPIDQAPTYTKNLAFDGTALGGIKQAATPATAPGIPSLYREMAALLSISDMNFADLMAQPSFRIPKNGLGMQVTTDGLGNVDSVRIQPSIQKATPGLSPGESGFNLMNRAEVMFRATQRGQQSPTAPVLPTQNPLATQRTQNTALPTNALQQLQGLERLQQPLNLSLLDRINGFDSNPILQRLTQLQAPDNGMPVIGYDSIMDPAQAKQIAVNQAGLEITVSPQFKANVENLVTAALEKNQTATAAKLSTPHQVMDGKVIQVPYMPQSAQSAQNASNTGTPFNLNGGLDDPSAKKGNGGYLYFQTNTGSSGGGEMGGGGQQKPFAFSQQQPRQQRKPLRYFA